MNWYLIVKYFHILAVAITLGGMLARQVVRAYAKNSDDVKVLAAFTHLAVRLDRAMVIPWSNVMILMGIVLAVVQKWPIFGFLQGSSQNWLLVSNILLIIMLIIIAAVFIPHNRKVEGLLQSALSDGRITPQLASALDDKANKLGHLAEEAIILVVAALMVLKPF
jgi:uncharacterized membrane protein